MTSQGGSSQSYAGGIVGSNSKGTIRSCRNSGALTAASSYMTCAGGIAGDMSGGSAANCFGTGAVSAGGGSGTNYAGGIAGDAFNSAAFTNCYSTGAVTASGTGTAAGGICGSESGNSVPVTNCFWLSTAADKLIGASQTTEITGCGTFADSTGALTAGTAENCGSVQTLAYGAELLAALNGWVTARASADYLTWAADSVSAPANDGYPVINVPEARWGTDDTCAAGRGTVTDAVTYANGLAGGTAYIQLLSGAKTTRMLEFSSGRTTVLDLNGFDIDRGSTTESESSVLDVQGSLTLRDTSANAATAPGKIKGGRFVHIGGVSVSKDGSLVMEGGSITGNTACGGSGGGGVRVDGSFVMTGGSITGNTCKSGGGGGVYVSGGSFTMTGGSITENSADLNGGGVYVSGGSLALGGAAEITGNTRVTGSTSAPDNVCLADGRTIAISPAPTNTTPIGVNMQTPGVFTSGSAVKNSDYLAKFTADSADCAVRAADNSQLRLVPAYAVTKAAPVNGSFTVKTGDSEILRAAEGDLVTITPAADSGYILDNITVTKTGDTAATVSVTTDTFTMPAYAVTVTLSFTPDVPSSPPPSSSPGGSAGSSSGGGGTTAPTVTVPVSSDAGKASVSASVTSGTASVTVTDSQLKTIVSDSTGTVKVDVSGLKNVTAAAVPAKVVEAAAKAGGGTGLAVSVPNGSVALDSTALGAVNTGSTVVVSVDPVAHEKLSETQKSVVPENAVIVDVNVLVNGAKVHDFNGGRITVSVPYTPAANEDTAALTVWYLDDAGGVTPMHGYFDAQTGAVVFTTTHLSQYVIARFPFADVAESSYAYTAVAWAVENGVTQGVGAASFAPEGVCSRAEAVTFLWRALGSPEPTGTDCPFADVSADAYYYKAVRWAAEKGIAVGTSAAGFSPSDTVTRAQALTFLWRAAGKPAADAANPFADVDAGAYYRSAVLWAVGRGVTNGTAADAFSPALGCTRAQIAAFLYRQLGK